MHVIATAGHVDHGKSALVRALTGIEPDRWAEERRRGMTIDLGFAWTEIGGEQVAFVDVPGHEKFVGNMLAGVGSVPAVLFVVAADEGWMPQSAEHLAALDALDVRHGVLAVTRSDVADPAAAREAALTQLAATSLGAVPAVDVCAPSGAGLPELRVEVGKLVAALPRSDDAAPVRLWIDRSFTIAGAGTVVTGTLAAGTVRVGQSLVLQPGDREVSVRGLQSAGKPRDEVRGVSRVAVNLRGVDHDSVRRGDALVAAGAWTMTSVVDVRLRRPDGVRLPTRAVLHLGAAAVPVRIRLLDDLTARLALLRPLPLHVLDRGLLRDPGLHQVIAGVTVLDVRPRDIGRRGGAATLAIELSAIREPLDAAAEVRRRGVVHAKDLVAMGFSASGAGWLVDPAHREGLVARLRAEVDAWATAHPLEPAMPVEAARQRLGLPSSALVEEVRRAAGLAARDGRIAPERPSGLPPRVQAAVEQIIADLRDQPFVAPDAGRLAELGIGPRELAAAVRADALFNVGDGIVLAPDADRAAVEVLARLPQPFTLSEARQALGTTRRVAVPLMELLDRRGLTERLPDDRRRVR